MREEVVISSPDELDADAPPISMVEVVHEPNTDVARPARQRRPEARPIVPPRRPDAPIGEKPEGPTREEGPERTQPERRRAPRPSLQTEIAETLGAPERTREAADATDEARSAVDRPAGAVDPLVIEPSTFGSSPWWSRGWWRITPEGSGRDIACDAGTAGSLAAAAVSLRGHKHRLDAAPNDDAFSLRTGSSVGGDEWLIGCVCDGVGSAARAHEGSQLVATTFTDALAELCGRPEWADGNPTSDTLVSTVGAVRNQVAEQLGTDLAGLDAFETTLTFIAVPTLRSHESPRRALIGWTGDSPALILQAGTWKDPTGALVEDAPGPSSTRTAGFLSNDRLEGFLSVELGPDDVVMLCSDGVGAFVTDGATNRRYGSTLAEVIGQPVDVLHLLNLLAFDMRSADDDRTALFVWQDVGPDAVAP